MMNKLLVSAGALALMAGAAAAQTGQINNAQFGVAVNIEVLPEVSMWAGDENIQLTMQGNDDNNSATAPSSLHHINNVPATISAAVTGTLPTPQIPGGGINFFIFYDEDSETDAVDAITANAYNPAGAAVWNVGNLGTSTNLGSVGAGPSVQNVPIVYASASPGELPAVADYNLLVTYTITAD